MKLWTQEILRVFPIIFKFQPYQKIIVYRSDKSLLFKN